MTSQKTVLKVPAAPQAVLPAVRMKKTRKRKKRNRNRNHPLSATRNPRNVTGMVEPRSRKFPLGTPKRRNPRGIPRRWITLRSPGSAAILSSHPDSEFKSLNIVFLFRLKVLSSLKSMEFCRIRSAGDKENSDAGNSKNASKWANENFALTYALKQFTRVYTKNILFMQVHTTSAFVNNVFGKLGGKNFFFFPCFSFYIKYDPSSSISHSAFWCRSE